MGDENLKIPINFAPLWQLRDPEELLISIGLFLHNISFNTVIFRKLYSFFFDTFDICTVQCNSSISKLHKKEEEGGKGEGRRWNHGWEGRK